MKRICIEVKDDNLQGAINALLSERGKIESLTECRYVEKWDKGRHKWVLESVFNDLKK